MLSVTQLPSVRNRMRVAAYVRVSSEEQVDGYSLDAQEKAIKRWALERGATIVKVYREEGQSAYRGNRSEFNRLIRDASDKHFEAVVVHKWDRFGRNREDVIINKFMLRQKCNVKIFSVTEFGQDDGNGISGMLLESVMESVNHWFSVNLGMEIVKASQEKHEQGFHLRQAPFGYDLDKRMLVINEREAEGVRRAFERYATGKASYNDIAAMLNSMGLTTKTGRQFSHDNIREMLRNPIYIGKVRYQRTAYNLDGSRSFANPVSLRTGLHQPIVEESLFDFVQLVQQKRKHLRGHAKPKPYLLRGLMYCERCTNSTPANALPSWGKMYCRQHSGHGTRYAYCDVKRRGHKWCGQSSVNVDLLEQQVIDLLKSLKPGEDWRNRAIEALAGKIGDADAQKKMNELRTIANNMDFRFDNGLIVDMDRYLEERSKIQELINRLTPLLTIPEQLVQAASLLNNFQQHFDECKGDVDKQHELIKLIIERVYVRDEKITRVVFTEDCELVLTGGTIEYVSDSSESPDGRKGT